MSEREITRPVPAGATSDKTSARRAIMVLGMHRSGTSVTAGVLHHLGFSLGAHLLDTAADNPTGYWENATVVRLDERMLQLAGRSWDDPRELPLRAVTSHDAADRDALRNTLRDEFGNAARIALKDPRMCLLSRPWIQALDAAEYRVGVLVVRRHPDAVVQSLDQRDGIHPLIGYVLYARYMLAAVRGAGDGETSAALDYDTFLSNWSDALISAFEELGLGDIPISGDAAERIEAFIDAGMSHARRVDFRAWDADTHWFRDFALRIYTFAGDVESWSPASIDDMEKALADALDSLHEAARARIDTHIRWCRRHEQEVSGLRDLFNANLDQLRRTDQALAEASALAVNRLATIIEHESRLESLAVELEVRGAALKEMRADLDSLATSESASTERVSKLQLALGNAHDDVLRQRSRRFRLVQRARALQRSVVALKHYSTELERRWRDVSGESRERLARIHEQESRLQQIEGEVERLAEESRQRLELIQERDEEALRLTRALESVTELSLTRLAHLEELDRSLGAARSHICDLEHELDAERALHARSRRQAQILRGRALRFASDAVNARGFWTWLIRVRLKKRKGG